MKVPAEGATPVGRDDYRVDRCRSGSTRSARSARLRAAELDGVLRMLEKEPWEICRMKEPIAAELKLASMVKDRAKWIEVMVAHPILIERPILVREDGKAVIGRSDEALEGILRR